MKLKKRPGVARILTAALIFQIVIGVLLVLGDVQTARFTLPGLGPNLPNLSEPIRPGDQRRLFRPDRHRPATLPARDPGELPNRLALTRVEDTTYRLEGAITAGDGERVEALLKQTTPSPEWLILQSPGGSVTDAIALGRYIRAEGINTRVLRGEYCYSACPYLLAGGVLRDIDDQGQVGVHQHYFGENSFLPASFAVEDIQAGQGEVMIFLNEMGVDPLIMQHALTTPPDEIYVLLPEELDRYTFRNPIE